jgi:hypothetical protein
MGKLVPCKTCNKKADSTAKSCPNCGVDNPGITGPGKFPVKLMIFIGIAFWLLLIREIPPSPPAKPVVYKDIALAQPATTPALIALPAPFKNPEEYLGMNIIDASGRAGVWFKSGAANSQYFDFEDENASLSVSATDGVVTWVYIHLKKAKPCYLKTPFDPKPFLLALGINPEKLESAMDRTHLHTFYDHKRRLKISVTCGGDGEPMDVFIGSKFYLQ